MSANIDKSIHDIAGENIPYWYEFSDRWAYIAWISW